MKRQEDSGEERTRLDRPSSAQVDEVCDRFEAAWGAGEQPRLENYFEELQESQRLRLLEQLLSAEWDLRRGAGGSVDVAEYLRRFPDHREVVQSVFDRWQAESALGETVHQGTADTSFSETHPEIPGYEILRVLGRGGMGVVYQARDLRLKRLVALKMILSGNYASSQEHARFRSEAEAVASFRHANIVQVYEVGTHESRPFMALEFVTGGSLAERLKKGRLTSEAAAEMVEQIADGMNAAHQLGIVHRDLKPANILLDGDGTPKITDFGLAKSVESDSGLTHTGVLLGTPSYMAPEQARGEGKRVGPAADVYSLGATLYECLTGRPPFRGDGPTETVMQVLEREPVAPRNLAPRTPRDLETICLKCLEKSPSKRYSSAAALTDDLRAWRLGEPIAARPIGQVERTLKWCRRRPALAALVVVSTLAAISLLTGGAYFTAQLRKERDEAVILKDEAVALKEKAELKEEEASREAQRAQEASKFLVGLFEDTDVFGLAGRSFGVLPEQETSAREILARGAKQLASGKTLADHPEARAELLDTVADALLSRGDVDAAEPLVLESLKIREESTTASDADLATSLHNLGLLLTLRGKRDEAVPNFLRAMQLRIAAHGEEHSLTLKTRVMIGIADGLNGRHEEEQSHLLKVVDVRRRELAIAREQNPDDVPARSEALAGPLTFLVGSYMHLGDSSEEAIAAVAELRTVLGTMPSQDKAAVIRHYIDGVVLTKVQFTRPSADREFAKAVEQAESVIGPKHYLLAVMLHSQAKNLFDMNPPRYEDAEVIQKRAVEILDHYFPTGSPYHSNTLYQLARMTVRGRGAAARMQALESIDDPDKYEQWMATHRDCVNAAETLIRRSFELEERFDNQDLRYAQFAWFLGHLLSRLKDPPELDEATKYIRLAWEKRGAYHGFDHDHTTAQLAKLLHILSVRGRIDELQSAFEQHLSKTTDARKWNDDGRGYLAETSRSLIEAEEFDLVLRLLEEAVEGGFDLTKWQDDPSLAKLKSRKEFQQLLEQASSD